MTQPTFNEFFQNIRQYLNQDFREFSIKETQSSWQIKLSYGNQETKMFNFLKNKGENNEYYI